MEVTKGLVAALTSKADFTVTTAVEAGFVGNDRIISNFMTVLDAFVQASPAVVKTIKGSSTITEAVNAISSKTLTTLKNKAIKELREVLEAKAYVNNGRVIGTDGVIEYAGILSHNVDTETANYDHKTYTAALLREITAGSLATTGIEGITARPVLNSVVARFLELEGGTELFNEFQENFSSALATGEYQLGFGSKYYNITKEDGEVHQEALLTTIEAAKLLPAYEQVMSDVATTFVANLNKAAEQQAKIQELKEEEAVTVEQPVVEVVEETVATTVEQPAEEVVTITVAEYNMLTAMESAMEKNTELLGVQQQRITEQEELLIKAAAALDAQGKQAADLLEQIKNQSAQIADLTLKLAQKPVVLATPNTNTNTEEETKMTNPTFKIEIKDLKVVAARPAKEDKVVSKDAIEGLEVGTVIKAQVATVSALKSVNEKIRVKAPEVTVKVANATHTGIDKVAEVAHKTTNVIAKAANTTVLKSANAVDAVLDFVAPTEKRVDVAAIRRMTSTVKIDDVVDIAGRKYIFKGDGNYEAL